MIDNISMKESIATSILSKSLLKSKKSNRYNKLRIIFDKIDKNSKLEEQCGNHSSKNHKLVKPFYILIFSEGYTIWSEDSKP